MSYRAPIEDMLFALDAAGFWASLGEVDPATLRAILESAASFAEEALVPLNRSGDLARAAFRDGKVAAAPGFAEAYKLFSAAGWQGLAADPAYGGQGLPRALALAAFEVVHAANMSFGLAPMLTAGAIEALALHGSAEQRQAYLPKLVSGEWTGTMNLTEPQAGSDLGALTTKAIPQADGSYRLTGQKVFITWGEHDLTNNIIHLVLARIEGAPAGSKGISLFMAPKILADGARNGLRCIGIEEKMGIHASPTCTMAFEGAKAWLVGAENRGLAAMFTMMNAARLNVGVQGVGVAEAAYQKAYAYAHERRQGGAPIAEHPDVRRMLAHMKSNILVGRALCYACAAAADRGERAREDILTPLAKAWCTDMAVEVASLGVQVHGGLGYVEEGGAAQFYRDARIAPIYEGTNGVQAIDLYGRKLLSDRGEAMRTLTAEAQAAARGLGGEAGALLGAAASALDEATAYVLAAARADALAGASAYLALAAETIAAGVVAQALLRSPDAERGALLSFFAATALARAPGRLAAIRLGAGVLA